MIPLAILAAAVAVAARTDFRVTARVVRSAKVVVTPGKGVVVTGSYERQNNPKPQPQPRLTASEVAPGQQVVEIQF
jgi:hypothetical protein